jgi:hypothetical protein
MAASSCAADGLKTTTPRSALACSHLARARRVGSAEAAMLSDMENPRVVWVAIRSRRRTGGKRYQQTLGGAPSRAP